MTARDDGYDILALTRHADPRVPRRALRELCPCELEQNQAEVWRRVLERVGDADPRVRSAVLHSLCDGSPRERKAEVLDALGRLAMDADEGIRRRARKVLAQHRRTGKINVL